MTIETCWLCDEDCPADEPGDLVLRSLRSRLPEVRVHRRCLKVLVFQVIAAHEAKLGVSVARRVLENAEKNRDTKV
jgi:hypothetical protein